MVHSPESQDGWSSLSSVDSLVDLSLPTPPPSKGGASGAGFRRLNARTAADIAKATSATAAMAERSNRLPSESDIKAERYRYAPPDREIWRPAVEQLSQKISEQQHELWELQAKLREEVHRSDELARILKGERREHKEVVTALTSELGVRRDEKAAAQAQAARRNDAELERAWKRCAELEQQRQTTEDDVARKRQEIAVLEAKLNESQTQIAGLKLLAAQPAMARDPKLDTESEVAAAELKRENADLRGENARLQKEIGTLVAALKNSEKNDEALNALQASIEVLKSEAESLKASNSTLQETNLSLKATLEQQAQETAERVKQSEEAAWQQASQLASERISQAVKNTETDVARLHEKAESQAIVIASQKEFLAMANSQLEYMRGLLGDSIGKMLDQRQHSLQARRLQPSPLHPSMFRPSPPPQESSRIPATQDSRSSEPKQYAQKASSSAFETPKSQATSTHLHDSHLSANNSPARTPGRRTSSTSDTSSLDSLSTIEPDSEPKARRASWATKNRAATYPLQQSTVNHSTTTAPSTSTPSNSEPQDALSGGDSGDSDSYTGVSFLDTLYERLANGKVSREELEDLENIYDARAEIMAERPRLEHDAKKMLTGLRPSISRKHATIVSRMAEDVS